MKTRLMVVNPRRLADWSAPPWTLLNKNGIGLAMNIKINLGDLVFFLKEAEGRGWAHVFHPASGFTGFLEADLLQPVEDDEDEQE
jgi:hypothetical protein